MQMVTSGDGTRIAFWRSGAGPPLLLVHGATADHTTTWSIPRELRGEQGYTFAPERFGNMRTPTLFLVGGDSPPRELENARGVAGALPDARVVVLPGQQHVAMHTAPDAFVGEVVRFLEE